MSLEDKFSGTLIGVACGDALGGPLETISKHPRKVPKNVRKMIRGGWLKLKLGQITDDTEMTLCIARSIAQNKKFDAKDIARRFVEWFYDSPIGAGGTTKTAIELLKQGTPWSEAGYNNIGLLSLGNGSVMRCSPVALLDYKNSKKLFKHSYEQSIITHPNPHCTFSAIFYNTIIANILLGDNKEKAYIDALKTIEHEPTLLKRYTNIPNANPNAPTGEVKNTIEAAIYSFLTTNTFEDAIIRAVNLGGDADTVGAVTGAIAGAYYGEPAIPLHWKEKLIDRHGIKILDELETLANMIYLLAQ